METLNNIVLVSGSGRNSGKTTVACHLIRKLARSGKVYGLKITPHFHLINNQQQLITSGVGYKIFLETDIQSTKDSSRMLYAGAEKVYFIQCMDKNFQKAFKNLKKLLPTNQPIVCESGALANYYNPGLHILVQGSTIDNSKKSYLENLKRADIILQQNEFSQASFDHRVNFSDNKWGIKKSLNTKQT